MTTKRSLTLTCIIGLLLILVVQGSYGQLPDSVQAAFDLIHAQGSLAADSTSGELSVPNVFTPNGDAVNDYFQVTTDGTTEYEFSVFTRLWSLILLPLR